MDLKSIDAAIESYKDKASEADMARLAFFRKIWGAMDEHTITESSYKKPGAATMTAAFHGGMHVFNKTSAQVEAESFTAAIEAIVAVFCEDGSFDEDVTRALGRVKWDRIVKASDLSLAGQRPADYLASCVEILVDDGADERAARVGALAMSYALRTQIEASAAVVAQACEDNNVRSMDQRTCPVCGTAPALARIGSSEDLMGRSRRLWCPQCNTSWIYDRIGCARCGCKTQKKLHQHNIEGDEIHRIASCDQCGGYIRTYIAEGNADLIPFSYEVEDVMSAYLDAIALDPDFKVAGK